MPPSGARCSRTSSMKVRMRHDIEHLERARELDPDNVVAVRRHSTVSVVNNSFSHRHPSQ